MKATNAIPKDNASLKSYHRLRPTWLQMLRDVQRLIVTNVGDTPIVSNGFWLLVDATVPDGMLEQINEGRYRWNKLNPIATPISPDETIGKQVLGPLDGCQLAEPIIAIKQGEKWRLPSQWRQDVLILRSEARDAAINVRFARWVEKYNEDKGQWYMEADNAATPLRYAVDGRTVGILMPIIADKSGTDKSWKVIHDVCYAHDSQRFYRKT